MAQNTVLKQDLPKLLGRRAALGGLASLVAGPALSQAACVADAQETAGPFPADGTNRQGGSIVNVLAEAGAIREDIRPSFAGYDGVAEGVDMQMEFALVDPANACAPVAGAALYAWHCDAAGRYSIYEETSVNYLRGVGVSDADGIVRFTSIFPGTYRGRWPHVHFEVFSTADDIGTGRDAVLTSQVLFTRESCLAVYENDPAYAASIPALRKQSLDSDNIFANDSAAQTKQRTVALSSPGDQLTARVTIGVTV